LAVVMAAQTLKQLVLVVLVVGLVTVLPQL
jgi:hypothetical protein